MKKTIQKQVDCCDACAKEDTYVYACKNCGTEHCYDCRETEGKEYSHAINFSGSGDGYYCNKCDTELTRTKADKSHAAYRRIEALRNEAKAWGDDFRKRSDQAEAALKALDV